MCEIRTFYAGDVFIEEGRAASLYALLEGAVEVFRAGGDGQHHRLAELGPGNLLGEIGLLRSTPAAASVRALLPSRCLVMDRWSFDQLAVHAPEAALHLSLALSETLAVRLERTSARLVAALETGGGEALAESEARSRFDALRADLFGGWDPGA